MDQQWENRRLAALDRYDMLDTPRERDFDDIAALASAICETPIAVVNLVGDTRQFFKAEVGLGVRETPIGSSFCAKAILEEDFLSVPDATQDHRFDCNPLVVGDPHLRFYAGALMKDPDGLPIGTVCVLDFKPRHLTPLQEQALRVLARQAMAQLELRRVLREQQATIVEQRQVGERATAQAAALAESQRLLRESLERSLIAQEAGRIGTFELDIASSEITVSEEFCRVFGLPAAPAYPAARLQALVVPDDRGVASDDRSRGDGSAALEAEYRIRRADDQELRWIARRARFVRDGAGRPVSMFGAVYDITASKLADFKRSALLRLGDRLRHSADASAIQRYAVDALVDTLQVARAGYAAVDARAGSFTIECNRSSEALPDLSGQHDLGRFAATVALLEAGDTVAVDDTADAPLLGADAARYAALGVRSLVETPKMRGDEVVGVLYIHDDKPRHWSRTELDFVRGVADRTYAALAKVRAEGLQHVLNQELSHRLKNTLAMVQAIARQTLRSVTDRASIDGFLARIQALAAAHDVLLQQSWAAARIVRLIDAAVALHGDASRFSAHGPDIRLGPQAALSLSLLLHELGTNAVKHGALSNDTGRVDIAWSIDPTGDQPMLNISWRESGGPGIAPPTREGFGSRLIGMGVAGSGDVERRYEPTGLIVTFQVPLAQVQSESPHEHRPDTGVAEQKAPQ